MANVKVQEIVYSIIKQNRLAGNPYITKSQILEEAKKTSLGRQDVKNYSGSKSRLQTQVDQAITQLYKKGRIIKKKHGQWTVETHPKIKQIVCKHIVKRDDRWYCPATHKYVADPKSQCNVLYGSDYSRRDFTKHGEGIIQIPRCVGFTDKKSTRVSIESAKESIMIQEAKELANKRKKGETVKDFLI